MNKYDALGRRLAESGLERVRLTFRELDELCNLPPTAYGDRPFWANTWVSHRAHTWLEAGYVVEEVSLGEFVTFLHDPQRAQDPGEGRKNRASRRNREGGRDEVGPGAPPRDFPDIPRPCGEEVERYLRSWEALEDYAVQEAALDDLFRQHCPENKSLSDILLKTAALNTFYSTNIFSVTPVARHILALDIDPRLAAGDLSLVDDLQRVELGGKEKRFYSFASKYCSHHAPEVFPIYDSYVEKMLCHFRDRDGFFAFRDHELKDYAFFRGVLARFQAVYGLERYSIRDVDKYLWQVGKRYLPNQYGKRG